MRRKRKRNAGRRPARPPSAPRRRLTFAEAVRWIIRLIGWIIWLVEHCP